MRGVATLKARALKEVWNIATVIPVDRGLGIGSGRNNENDSPNGNSAGAGEGLIPEDNFLGICNQELLSRGRELLKRTRNGNRSSFKLTNICSFQITYNVLISGDLHWKIVSVYIHRTGQVIYSFHQN